MSQEETNYQETLSTFGWGTFRPAYLKFLTSSKWFVVIIMVYTLGAGRDFVKCNNLIMQGSGKSRMYG